MVIPSSSDEPVPCHPRRRDYLRPAQVCSSPLSGGSSPVISLTPASTGGSSSTQTSSSKASSKASSEAPKRRRRAAGNIFRGIYVDFMKVFKLQFEKIMVDAQNMFLSKSNEKMWLPNKSINVYLSSLNSISANTQCRLIELEKKKMTFGLKFGSGEELADVGKVGET
ncbi:hypothetical protein L596_028743 [Steinernema carpocapsae]|uniref:Uncharacterized protein n=1 Tax=Steinernema carpocapsae TaxID=34508 RepID=A0A4U5LZ88_STECR|nr:hypothetical protein L596_028743 [Steinernema carpocapsae]